MRVHDILLNYFIIVLLKLVRVVDKINTLSLTPIFWLTYINLASRMFLH